MMQETPLRGTKQQGWRAGKDKTHTLKGGHTSSVMDGQVGVKDVVLDEPIGTQLAGRSSKGGDGVFLGTEPIFCLGRGVQHNSMKSKFTHGIRKGET